MKPYAQLKKWDKFIRWTLTLGAVFLAIGAIHDWAAPILIGAFLLTFPWMLTWGWHYGRMIGDEIRVASQDIPSPQYIAAELRKEWGREPTMSDVAAVHTMLTNRHNQALLNTGIGLGALYLMNKNLHQ